MLKAFTLFFASLVATTYTFAQNPAVIPPFSRASAKFVKPVNFCYVYSKDANSGRSHISCSGMVPVTKKGYYKVELVGNLPHERIIFLPAPRNKITDSPIIVLGNYAVKPVDKYWGAAPMLVDIDISSLERQYFYFYNPNEREPDPVTGKAKLFVTFTAQGY